MKKTHTFSQTLTANTFNDYDSTGDGVLWMGPVLFSGTIVTIGGYRIRYNGIIVEDLSVVTHDTVGYKYLCVAGVDASPSSAPYTLVSNVKQGVCLIEEYLGGWITKGKIFDNDYRGLPFHRESDVTGSEFHACFGPGVASDGTVVHTPIKIPFAVDTATGQLGVSDKIYISNTTALAAIDGHYCNGHLFVCNDTVATDIVVLNDKLYTIDGVAGVNGASLAVIETDDAHCLYAYTVADHLYIGEIEYGVATGAATDYTLPSAIARVEFVTSSTVLIQLADSTFIYGMIMPTTIDTLWSGSSRWFHIDHKNGDFLHIGTDDKLYKNTVLIGSCADWVFIHDGHIIQLDGSGVITEGGKVLETGYSVVSVVSNRAPTGELFLLFVNAAGVDAVSYDIGSAEVVYSANLSGAATLAACTFGQNVTNLYLDSDLVTYEQPVAVGALPSPPDTKIIPSQTSHWRFGKKYFQADGTYNFESIYTESNTTGVITDRVATIYLGTFGSYTIIGAALPVLVGPAVCDGDMLEYTDIMSGAHEYARCLAIDTAGVPSALLTNIPGGIIPPGPVNSISSGISLAGGICAHMVVNASNSVVLNMTITTLDINIARNVMFIGCDITVYNDLAVLPDYNTYQFIGCTIGGVPANTFQALTDTPMAYTPAQDEGRLVVVNATPDALEFTAAARINAGLFEFDRVDYVDGVEQVAYDSPSPMDIHTHTGDPTGFENLTDSVISYDPATRTLTLTPVGSFAFWRNGIRYEYTAPVIFPPHAPDSGTHFFYFDDSPMPTAATSPLFWDLSKYVPVSYVQYNAALADGYANEERHGMCMDWATHRHLHLTVGAFAESGFGLGDVLSPAIPWVSNASNKITVDLGIVADEDLENSNGGHLAANPYTFMYRAGATGIWTWVRSSLGGTTYPYSISGGWITYNDGTWALTPATHNTFVNSFVFATNSIDSDFEIVVVPGQALHVSLSAAKEETVVSLAFFDKPFQEWVPLYRLTYQAQNGWDVAAGRARIVDYVRLTGTSSIALSASVSYHGALGGLSAPNSHPATAIGYDNQLETQTVQTDVQAAIDELYNINVEEASFTSPAPYEAVQIKPDYTTFTGANDIVSCTVDVVGTVVEVTYSGPIVGPIATLKDAFHRSITFSMLIDAGVVTSILAQDETIYYEHTCFEDARLDPLAHLGNVLYDYVDLATDGTITVRGINFSGGPDTSTVRYAARFSYNKVSHVP